MQKKIYFLINFYNYNISIMVKRIKIIKLKKTKNKYKTKVNKLNYKKSYQIKAIKARKARKARKTRKKKCLNDKPTDFIFGYGSLINNESRSYTGKKIIGKAIPVELSKKAGFQRVWVCKKTRYGKKSFLGLNKTTNNSHNINGIITPIYKCIKKFDKREKGYKRIRIKYNPKNNNIIRALSWQNLPDYPCNIYIYINKEKMDYPMKECPISQNYLDIVMLGCLEYGENFAKFFIKNTFNWKNENNKVFWINDRNICERKWIHKINIKKQKKIDKILKNVIPNILKKRV